MDGLVGRINGALRHAALGPGALHLPGTAEPDLVALYRAADVMLVTPLRDGMNLVAKEFIASRSDGDGVLVLSEFAGAAWELPEALQVNPYDVEGAAEVLLSRAHDAGRGAARPPGARSAARVQTFDVHRWVATFLEQLEEITPARPRRGRPAGARRPRARR